MKTLTTKLHTLTTNKVEIKTLQTTNTKLVSEIMPLVKDEIIKLRDSNKYKDTKFRTLAGIVKSDEILDSKELLINTCLNIVAAGINIDYTLPVSKINQVITLLHKKVITKNWVNKATKEDIIKKLAAINKAHKVELATKLVSGKKPANKAKKVTPKKAA